MGIGHCRYQAILVFCVQFLDILKIPFEGKLGSITFHEGDEAEYSDQS